jgi:hypothetical protein
VGPQTGIPLTGGGGCSQIGLWSQILINREATPTPVPAGFA